MNDWSASVLACNERRFDAKTPVKIYGASVATVIFALSRSLQAGTLALQSN